MRRIAIVSAVLMAGGAGAPSAAAPPISAYGQLPAVDDVEISPDGARFVAVIGDETARQIQVREIGTNAMIAATPIGKSKVRDLIWVGPNHVVAAVSTTGQIPGTWGPKQEWWQLLDFNVAARKWHPLLNGIDSTANVIAGGLLGYMDKNVPTLITHTVTFPSDRDGLLVPFRINLDSGRPVKIMEGTGQTSDWLSGADGQPIARADSGRGGEWVLWLRGPSGWKRAYSEMRPNDQSYIRSLGIKDGTILVSSKKTGEWETYEVDLATGQWSDPLEVFKERGIISDPKTRRPIGSYGFSLEDIDYSFFEPNDQKLWNSVRKAFPGEHVSFVSWTDDRNRIIAQVEGPTNGSAYFIVDRQMKAAAPIAPRYPGVAATDYNPVRAIRYKAADGTEIPAYLTLPKGRPETRLPMVVLVHGGPASRDTPGFDWWPQALASRGYAVLQPQFRGSSGFGQAHLEAGFGQWGRKMQTDVSDGVRHLATQGMIDPKRVCVVGASYGGYATLASVTVETGLYRCASGVAGVYDLRQFLTERGANDIDDTPQLRFWRRFMGAQSDGDRRLDEVSPARLAARAQGVPIQLIHGKDDTVVRYAQTETMVRALTAAGNPPELVTLAGEDHWLSRGDTRLQMLTAQIAFLEKHNPPDRAPAGTAP